MDPKAIEAFRASLQGYYNNKCLSDVVIRCNGQEFAVHSLVLFCHSDYFKRQLTGPWKESEDKIIEITDFDANIVEAMLRFVYSFDYDVPPDTSPMICHAKVYQIGDKYGIETLKKHSLDKFKRVFEETEITTENTNDLVDVITAVYTTTPPGDRGLRDIVVERSYKNLDELMGDGSFQEGLVMNGDFSADLLKRVASRRGERDTYKCKCYGCNATFTLKIESLGNGLQLFLFPRSAICPVCGWKPGSSNLGRDWLFYFRRNSVFMQADGTEYMDMWNSMKNN